VFLLLDLSWMLVIVVISLELILLGVFLEDSDADGPQVNNDSQVGEVAG